MTETVISFFDKIKRFCNYFQFSLEHDRLLTLQSFLILTLLQIFFFFFFLIADEKFQLKVLSKT